ncbi:hypothetical protein ACFVVU_37380 [Kitasatospora sp. NPDC057965]|uniref:hypothetical protein n=1 Tax=Kitasatospora sp. NPDC057965 TaxID=3346291 RepID=UPI0036DC7A87
MVNNQIPEAAPETDPGRSGTRGPEGDEPRGDEAEATVAVPEIAARPTLHGRAHRYWADLSPRKKAFAIGGGLAALTVVGTFLVHRRERFAPGEDTPTPSGPVADLIQSGMDKLRSLQSADEPFDGEPDSSAPGTPTRYVTQEWDVDDYMRDTCLDRALHPDGCRHEDRPVRGGTRSRNPELLASDD